MMNQTQLHTTMHTHFLHGQHDDKTTRMIENILLFSDLPEDYLKHIASCAVSRNYPKNSILITEGDQSDSLYIIESGRVKIFLNDESGKEVILNIQGQNEYFGELAMLDEAPRSASVMTLEPSRFSIISKVDFDACLKSYPDIAVHLIRALAGRIRALTENVRDLALHDVYERVASLLLKMAQEQDNKLTITQKLTHQEIANMVGASREMISRIMKDLTTGGYIESHSKQITILKKLPAHW